jgi:type III restriction enzyme
VKLKEYQEEAVNKLFASSIELLGERNGAKLVLKAPTGSGKTIMMAEFLTRLNSENSLGKPISVIWTAPRKLHTQSMEKLKGYFLESNSYKCSEFSSLAGNAIAPSEILFLNWESINKTEKNTIVKENEKEFYLEKVVQNTKDKDHVLILVIDESHHHATSEISRNLILEMQPDLTIEVSATPILNDIDGMVGVQIDRVKEEGMIKKGITLNPNFDNSLIKNKVVSSLSDGTDLFVLDQGMNKLFELSQSYGEVNSKVNPLLLIQLPDKKSDLQETLMDEILDHLHSKHGMSVENGKVAIYLSESKENLENIAKNDSPVQVMLFKQAIALGWDCPRASILVLFRDHKSLTFSVQTVGRIMRMPEPDLGHYSIEVLNHAYVYTNLADISINEDVSGGYLTVLSGKRKEGIEELSLKSVYRQRHRDKTRLSSTFTSVFLETASKNNLKKSLNFENPKVAVQLISDYSSGSADQLVNSSIHGSIEIDLTNENDLQRLFDFFIVKNLHPYFPERRSVGRIKDSIYKFLRDSCEIDFEEEQIRVFELVLDSENQRRFSDVIDETKNIYAELVSEREQKLEVQLNWDLPLEVSYASNYLPFKASKSAMEPFYSDMKWKSENAFIELLEASGKVKWWFKNGDRDATYFAVPYAEDGDEKPFYVDFIVSMADGSLALFDTKSGQTIETAKSKSDGLQTYIKENKDMFGGIATNTKSDYSGRWVYFIRYSNELSATDFSNWENLNF